jgi:organic hydroperoxide reductase OsmC/OhrA
MVDGKYLITEITLMPVVSLVDADEKEKAEKVLQKAEANCLISNSVRSKILFQPEVKISDVMAVK